MNACCRIFCVVVTLFFSFWYLYIVYWIWSWIFSIQYLIYITIITLISTTSAKQRKKSDDADYGKSVRARHWPFDLLDFFLANNAVFVLHFSRYIFFSLFIFLCYLFYWCVLLFTHNISARLALLLCQFCSKSSFFIRAT